MNAKRVMLSVLCATAGVGVAVWLAVEYQGRLRLGEENKALRQQLDQIAGLVAENERLSNLVAQANSSQSLPDERLKELLRLRGEVGVLRQQSKELEALREKNRQARAALDSGHKPQDANVAGAAATADYWPRGSWAFAGYASPEAALQSFFWAANKGDVKTLQGGITDDIQKEISKASPRARPQPRQWRWSPVSSRSVCSTAKCKPMIQSCLRLRSRMRTARKQTRRA
jgi:hypothetical protein